MTDAKSTDAKRAKLYTQRTAQSNAAYLVPHIEPHFKILDVGCGPGSITLDFARLVTEGSVTGIDINSGFIEKASQAAKEQGIQNAIFKSGVSAPWALRIATILETTSISRFPSVPDADPLGSILTLSCAV